MWSLALLDHFKKTYIPERIYSMPSAASAKIASMTDFFGDIATQPSPMQVPMGADAQPVFQPGVDAVAIPELPRPLEAEELYFQVGMINTGTKKVLKVAPGAGEKITSNALTILAHRVDFGRSQADTSCVSAKSLMGDVFIVSDLGDPNVLRSDMKLWSHAMKFTLGGADHLSFVEPALSQLITCLVLDSAFPQQPIKLWPVVQQQWRGCVDALVELGFVKVDRLLPEADERVCMQPKLLQGDYLQSYFDLSSPTLAFAPRLELPLEDRSCYELLVVLIDERGWTWHEWLTKFAKMPCKLGYKPGDDKFLYSRSRAQRAIMPHYLLALLKAEDCYGSAYIYIYYMYITYLIYIYM